MQNETANDWRKKLDIFLSDFEYASDLVGVLVCGSYVTGNPTSHSDLDVHLILDDVVVYRERGNRIIDGLLIEYFANPPKQILCYFEDDFHDRSLMAQTQFATGLILMDKTGDAAILKDKAETMIADLYAQPTVPSMNELEKYGLWDIMDDLQDAYKTQRMDFDFLYFNCLNRLIECYMKRINRPYNVKTILGNIVDDATRKKYLLQELPDPEIKGLIAEAIVAEDKGKKLDAYEKLTIAIINQFGGFSIDGFKFKSNVEYNESTMPQ